MPDRFHPRVLIIEAPAPAGASLGDLFREDEHEIVRVSDQPKAAEDLTTRQYAVALLDLDHARVDGIELLRLVRSQAIPTEMVALSGSADRELAIQVMKAGAADFLVKPIEPDLLRLQVQKIVAARRLAHEMEQLRSKMDQEYRFHDMISRSPKMLHAFRTMQQLSSLGSNILIHGETGTGKELVARAIHAGDTRRRGAFVAVNCAVLRDTLLENELFGHEAGAYTGADRRAKGRFELADGGTLFLDEVAEIPPPTQAKMLRALQSGTFERIGGEESIRVDVRVVAASNKRLEDEVKAGRFRSDLMYRLKVVQVDLPPLRDRKEDVPLLAAHFLRKCEGVRTPAVRSIHPEAMLALMTHDWPGNVRELENAIKAGVALCDGTELRRDDLPEEIAPRSSEWNEAGDLVDIDRPLLDLTSDLVAKVEREYLSRILERFRGNVAQAARHSGLSRRSVTQKVQKYELERGRFKSR